MSVRFPLRPLLLLAAESGLSEAEAGEYQQKDRSWDELLAPHCLDDGR